MGWLACSTSACLPHCLVLRSVAQRYARQSNPRYPYEAPRILTRGAFFNAPQGYGTVLTMDLLDLMEKGDCDANPI